MNFYQTFGTTVARWGFFGRTRDERWREYMEWMSGGKSDDVRQILILFPEVDTARKFFEQIVAKQSSLRRVTLSLAAPCPRPPRQRIATLPPEDPALSSQPQGPPDSFGIIFYNSGLPIAERRRVWQAVARGEANVIIGTRSALFLPFRTIAGLVVEDPADPAYTSERHPRLNAAVVAEYLAEKRGFPIVFGGRVPPLEMWHRIRQGEVREVESKTRASFHITSRVEILDLRKLPVQRERRMLPPQLISKMERVLSQNGRTVLVVPRKGFFTLAACSRCREVLACPQCGTPLSHSAERRKLRCAHCSFAIPDNPICPKCHSGSIQFRGVGAERIVQWLTRDVTHAKILRLDRDIAPRGTDIPKLLAPFQKGECNVLVCTPFILRSLEAGSIALMAFLAADYYLRQVDYHAEDIFYRLLVESSDLISSDNGEMVLQSYMPDHPFYLSLAETIGDSFWDRALADREKLGYPPFLHIYVLTFRGKAEKSVADFSKRVGDHMRKSEGKSCLAVLGPIPAHLPKKRGKYQFQILIKGSDVELMAARLTEIMRKNISRDVQCAVDLDPPRMQ